MADGKYDSENRIASADAFRISAQTALVSKDLLLSATRALLHSYARRILAPNEHVMPSEKPFIFEVALIVDAAVRCLVLHAKQDPEKKRRMTWSPEGLRQLLDFDKSTFGLAMNRLALSRDDGAAFFAGDLWEVSTPLNKDDVHWQYTPIPSAALMALRPREVLVLANLYELAEQAKEKWLIANDEQDRRRNCVPLRWHLNVRPSELAPLLGMNVRTLNGHLDVLEKGRWLRRQHNPLRHRECCGIEFSDDRDYDEGNLVGLALNPGQRHARPGKLIRE